MPEGQFSGSRSTYEYLSDGGVSYLIQLDDTLASLAGTGLVAAVAGTTSPTAPKRFSPRVVFWEGTLNGNVVRKQIVCAPTGTLYQSNVSQSLTVDGVAGVTTGRRGERLSFLKLPAA